MKTLDEACRDFAATFGEDGGARSVAAGEPANALEQKAWKEGLVPGVG